MISALLLAVVTSPAAPQWSRDGKLPNPETVSAMVNRCGVVEAQIAFSDLFEGDAVTLPAEAVLSELQIACLARVSFDTGFEFFLPDQFSPLFYQQREAIAEPWNLELARQWLDDRGKLTDLPIRAPNEPDEAFAQKLERLCDADGALSSNFGTHSISPAWMTGQHGDFEQMGAAMLCLSSAGTASDFQIGFIGNDKYREDN